MAESAFGQAPAPAWYFESVASGNLVPGCVSGGTLAGFEIDAQGRPALAWREDNSCGGAPRVFWSRFESGAWQNREFTPDRGNAHAYQFALRATDGHPFMLFAAMGQFFETNTYRTNLDPPNQPSSFLENVVPPQNCDNARYSLAFGPNDTVPQWTTGVATCNGQGAFRLNGVDIVPQFFSPHGSLAVAADGTRHVLWNSGTHVFYTRVPPAASTPDHQATLFTDLNRFGGEVKIAIDGAGVLHAIVKGPDVTADWDLGAIVYVRSDDNGATWSSWEYVDSHDDPAVQDPWNGNSDVSLAVAPDGVPAITFWRWNSELWYAKRDGAGGTWTHQLITALPFGNGHRTNQLRFDSSGQPLVAFYDPAINRLRLARPIPAGVTEPVDVSVRIAASPAAAPAGSPASWTLTVTNNSDVNLDRVVVTNRLPAGVAMTAATPAPDAYGKWTMALTSRASRTIVIDSVLPSVNGVYVDVATAQSDVDDANPEDNAATAAIVVGGDVPPPPVAGTDLGVTVTASPAIVAPTGVIVVNVAVRNNGSTPIASPMIELAASGGAMVDLAPGASSLDPVVINPGPLEPGETRWIIARVMAPLVAGTFTLSATQQNGADANAANDASSATVIVRNDGCFVAPTDLVGRWRFDDDGSDEIGGRTALLQGATAFDVGQNGKGLLLGGLGYGEVPDETSLKPEHLTIAAWIKPSSTVNWNSVIAKGASGLDGNMVWFDDTFWLGLSAGGYPTLYTYHGFTRETKAAEKVAPGVWHHLAATYDGSVARLYVNGAEVAASTIDQPLYYDVNPVPLTIGEDWQGGSANGAPFSGMIDDVTLHSRALSAEDVAAMIGGSSSECVIAQPNEPPTTNMQDLVLIEGAPAIFRITMTDPEHAPVVGSMAGLPPGVTATSMAPTAAAPFYHLAFDGSPLPGSAGSYPVVMTMTDGVNTVTRQFTITVRPPNQPPIALNDSAVGIASTGAGDLIIPVLANDSDPEGDAIRIVAVTQPASGEVQQHDDHIVYRPRAENYLTESFSYTIEDGLGATATATVTVRLLVPGPNLVVSSAPALTIREGQPLDVEILITNQGASAATAITGDISTEFLQIVGASVPEVNHHLPAIGALAGGDSLRFTITVQPISQAPRTATLEVSVRTEEEDVDRHGDNVTVTTIALQPEFCFVPQAGLLGFWPADGHWLSRTDFGPGWGPPDAFRPSRVGRAFALDGDPNSYGDFEATSWVPRTFTISAWAKRAPGAGGIAPVMMLRANDPLGFVVPRYWMGFEDDRPVLVIYEGDEIVAKLRGNATPDATWVHLAGSYDGVTARLYVNGSQVASNAVQVAWEFAQHLYIGYGQSSVGKPPFAAAFNGLIDDVMIHNRALLPAEISRMIAGDFVKCAVATAPAAAVTLEATPAFAFVNKDIAVTATVTNTGNGYLELPTLFYERPVLSTIIAATPAPKVIPPGEPPPPPPSWNLVPLLIGESATVTIHLQAPPVDAVFPHRAWIHDLNHGYLAETIASVTVAPEECRDIPREDCVINSWPSIAAVADRTNRIDDAVDIVVDAFDPDAADTLTFSATNLPKGVSIDPATGRISGVILFEGSGTRMVTVTAGDGRLSASTTFRWVIPHRLIFNVAAGGVLPFDNGVCDARQQARTCTVEVNDGDGLPLIAINDLPFAWITFTPPRNAPAVTFSAVADVVWVSTFEVTFDRQILPGLFTASVPAIVKDQRDYMICNFLIGEPLGCRGQAMVGSTVELWPGSSEAFRFTGFSGACEGMTCPLVITGSHQVVHASWERLRYDVTLDVGPGGSVTAFSVAAGETTICDGGTTGASCVIRVPTNTTLQLTPSRPEGASARWQWTWLSGDQPFPSHQAVSTAITAPARFEVIFHNRLLVWVPGFQHGLETPIAAEPFVHFVCQGQPVLCEGSVPAGQSVVLVDSPDQDAELMAWGGACTGPGTCTVSSLDRDIVVDAQFGYTTTFRVGRGGQIVSEDGLTCSIQTDSCSVTRPVNSLLRMTGVPVLDGMQTAWVGAIPISGPLTQNLVTILADRRRSVDVTFVVPVWIVSDFGRLPLGVIVPDGYPGTTVPQLSSSLTPGMTTPLIGNQIVHVPFENDLSLKVVNGVTAFDRFVAWRGDCTGPVCAATIDRVGMMFEAHFNHPPYARSQPVEMIEDVARMAQSWFVDVDGDALSLEVVSVTPPDLLQLVPGQVFSEGDFIVPSPNQYGSGILRVRATDPSGLSLAADIHIDIEARNDPPTISPDVIPPHTVVAGRTTALPIFTSPGPNEPASENEIAAIASAGGLGQGTFTFVNGQLHVTPASRETSLVTTATILVLDSPLNPQVPGQSNRATRTFELTVLPDSGNTPIGAAVQVVADGGLAVSPISVAFPQVTASGHTTYKVGTAGLVPPDGFLFGATGTWFDIETTATFVAPLRVCITYAAGEFVNPLALKLFHHEGGRWVDRTISVDVKNRIVCGSVGSLSPFALAEPIAIEGRMHGEAHLEAGGREYDVRFRIAERKFGWERGALNLKIDSRPHGKQHGGVDRFESTAIDDILFFDDPAFRPGRSKKPRPAADSAAFTGAGQWNGMPGYTFEARAIDRGEPGRGRDRFSITIFDPAGLAVHTLDAVLEGGNVQSDRLKPEHWRDRARD